MFNLSISILSLLCVGFLWDLSHIFSYNYYYDRYYPFNNSRNGLFFLCFFGLLSVLLSVLAFINSKYGANQTGNFQQILGCEMNYNIIYKKAVGAYWKLTINQQEIRAVG